MGPFTARRLALVLGLAPAFRLAQQSFWYDELFTLFVARQPVAAVFEQAANDGFTPPLYYLLVKLLIGIGLPTAMLRGLSVGFGALFLVGLAQLATRLGGERVATVAVLLAGLSPFYVSMAQELRPYTAFLACAAFAIDGLLSRRGSERGIGALWTLLSTLFSYLGFALVAAALVAAFVAPRPRRRGVALALGLALACALTASPGLRKARFLLEARSARHLVAWPAPRMVPFARLFLGGGLRPEPVGDARDRSLGSLAEWLGRGLATLGLGIGLATRRRALAGAAVALLISLASVYAADALLGIGVTTRYLAVAFVPLALTTALLASALGRLAPFLLLSVLAVQAAALERYLFEPAYARDDWRAAIRRLAAFRQPGDLVLGFPANHVAVALAEYAPTLEWLGGFVGRRGEPVYLYREQQAFRGYDFDGQLEEIGSKLRESLERRIGSRRVLLLSYADDDWHGDMQPIVEASGKLSRVESFPARETILLRVLVH